MIASEMGLYTLYGFFVGFGLAAGLIAFGLVAGFLKGLFFGKRKLTTRERAEGLAAFSEGLAEADESDFYRDEWQNIGGRLNPNENPAPMPEPKTIFQGRKPDQ